MEVADPGKQKDPERDPAQPAGLLTELPKDLGPELRGVELAEHGCANRRQEEHPAQPAHGREDVNRDVELIE